MGLFGIGERKREKVKKIREKERKQLLEYRREERGRVAKRRELLGETKLTRAEAVLLETKARKREAKREALWYLPTPKIKKKKQRRKLSRKSRIGLI